MPDTTELTEKAKAVLADLAEKGSELAAVASAKLSELAQKHGDTVTDTVSKAADYVDEKSGGKTSTVTAQVKDFTKSTVDSARGAAPSADSAGPTA